MTGVAPTGTITLMFTDIQGSTELWEALGDAFRPVLDRHNALVRETVARWDGFEVKSQGDSFMVAFQRGTDAVLCALDVQRALESEPWAKGVKEVLVRIGVHMGEPFLGYDPNGRPDYFGPVVNRAARTSAAGHGGQILISAAVRDSVLGALTADVVVLDLGTHRLRGLDQPEHLFEVRHPELQQRTFPPLKTLDTLRLSLPVYPNTFVGRDEEVETVLKQLAPQKHRLVTLVGPAGMGKTRLAVQVVERCAEHYDDGAWWVPLASARTAETALAALAEALQLQIEPQVPLGEQVMGWLATRQVLLLLDNMEQIVDGEALVHEILTRAPRAKCLVTTRRALGLQAEQVVELDALRESDAAALFLDRARGRRADLVLTHPMMLAVSELCRRLERVPLAIELAASRSASMTPQDILDRLGERLDLLQTRAPDLPPRQRSLRAAIGWSYELLTPIEQQVFSRLSVFRGGFFRDSARAVCGDEAGAVVPELRDRSLVRAEAVQGHMWYWLQDSVREFALENLPNREEFAWRHAIHHAALAEAMSAALDGPEEASVLERAARTLSNLEAAWLWAQSKQDFTLVVSIATAACPLLRRLGRWNTRQEWLAAALQMAEGSPDPGTLAQLRYELGYALMERGDFDAARPLLEASLEDWRSAAATEQRDSMSSEADCLNRLGNLCHYQGRLDEARTFYEEALFLRQLSGDLAGEASILNNFGVLAIQAGRLEEARARFEESLLIDRQLENTAGIALMLNNLGRICLDLGDVDEARRLLEESRSLKADLGDRSGLAHTLHNLGEVALAANSLQEARGYFLEALTLRRELAARHELAESLAGVGRLSATNQEWQEAGLYLTAAQPPLTEAGSGDLEAVCLSLEQVEAAMGPERFAQMQRMARRFRLEQVADRALQSAPESR